MKLQNFLNFSFQITINNYYDILSIQLVSAIFHFFSKMIALKKF